MTYLLLLLLATNGGARTIEPVGWDAANRTLTIISSVEAMGELLTVTWKGGTPGAPTPRPWATTDDQTELASLRKTLTPLAPIDSTAVQLAGRIVAQRMEQYSSQGWKSLYPVYDVEVRVAWNAARKTVRMKAWRTPEVHLTGAWEVPGTGCALLALAVTGQPYEGGYPEAQPVIVCSSRAGK
ncbi:MAG: hypothetical protein KC933_13800 [Myxococcales bacterium]|nr:hypothetical protein [Myxococcales bacterium]MCB9647474.1 hypothetical protein [Deltaproteobacteria bacterium]